MRLSFLRTRRTTIGATFIAGLFLGVAGTGFAASLGSNIFSDVTSGSFYDVAVGEMYNAGIIKGYDGTSKFGPNDYVTRAQVAVMMQRLRNDINGISNDEEQDDDNNNDDSSSSVRSSSSKSSSSSSSTSSAAASNNPKGSFRFTTAAYTVNENQATGTVTIAVVRTGGNQGSVAVNYEITGNSATAGNDFETISGTLNFATKETSKTFTITIKNDSSSEGNETATIKLSSPTNGGSLGNPSTATLTIIDDESGGSTSTTSSAGSNASTSSNPKGTLSLAATSYMVAENGGSLTVTVQRTGGSSSAVGVSYATSNGTAVSGKEYGATSGILSFGAGETSKTFTISIDNDDAIDGAKAFNVTLSSVTGGATLGTPASATVTIFDEDAGISFGSGSIKLSKDSYEILETSGKADITVMRTGGANGPLSIQYSTSNGTATSGLDYTALSGTLTFAAGESGKVITIPVVKDSDSENGEENFYFNLTDSTGRILLLNPYSATVTIAE